MSKRKQAGRIVKGFVRNMKGFDEEFAQKRLETCNGCEFLKESTGQCGVCDCFVKLKTKVEEEYCPKNFWEDTYINEKQGIAIINLSPKIVKMKKDNSSHGVVLEFKEPQNLKEPTEVDIMIVNDRKNHLQNPDDFDLTDIQVSASCKCSVTSDYPKKLDVKDFFKVKLNYRDKVKGGFRKTFDFTGKYKNGRAYLNIILKGEVR